MRSRRFAVRSKTNAALLRGHERPCSSFAPRSFFSLCARQHRPARQVLIMIPVTEKLFEKEGEHAHDPVFFLFAHPESPHHRSESSLSEATVSWEFVLGVELVGLRSNHAARARSREVRSLLALEMAARKMLPPVRLVSATAFARLHFASCVLRTDSI
jgi:hypothetical protein